ncbi:MAG TPA: radical SAM protein [bacterium]|nr:radical SAM protein [bacterium]HPJ71609.1 radical SAM protein [bacterium]HPQ66312.1 radical SAM protein [bacterium]
MILLIFPNPSPFPYHAMTPLAVFSVGTYLEQAGVEVEYYDERVQDRNELDAILARRPSLIGISALTSFQIERGLTLTRYVRERLPGVPVAWGGVHPSMMPEQTLARPEIDFVVIREGEETTLDLYRALAAGTEDFGSILGLAWKNPAGDITVNPSRPFLEADLLPFPYQGRAAQLFPRYLRPDASFPTIGYQASRGCPYSCRFCYNDFFNQRICRRKSLDKVRDELAAIRGLGADNIFFYDDSMGGRQDLLYDLVSVMSGLSLKWSASPRIHFMTEELVRGFERTGCQWLFFGIESPLDRMLRYMKKGITREQIETGISLMRTSSIITTYSLMVGFPGETYEDSLAVLDFADELHERHPSAEIVIQPYAPLPGTDLYQEALEHGFQPPPSLEDWSRFTMDRIHTPWLKSRPLFANVYLISFLAFRYEHMLGDLDSFRWAYRIAHHLAAFRWKRRWFRFYLEGACYRAYNSFSYWKARRRGV